MNEDKKWTFLTSHALVLNCIAHSPSITALEISANIGIQERSIRRIIADLVEAGYLSIKKEGRRNRYTVRADLPLRHPSHNETEVGELLSILHPKRQKRSSARSKQPR